MMYGHTKIAQYVKDEYAKGLFLDLFYDYSNICIKNFIYKVDRSRYRTDEVIERM